MDANQLEQVIDAAWEDRDNVSLSTKGEIRDAVEAGLSLLDSGAPRRREGRWHMAGQSVAQKSRTVVVPPERYDADPGWSGWRTLVG